MCIALCTIVAHNIAQNRPDSFPPYPPDNHHYSDDVYLREGGLGKLLTVITGFPIFTFTVTIIDYRTIYKYDKIPGISRRSLPKFSAG